MTEEHKAQNIEIVKHARTLAAHILIKAQMGMETTIHPKIGTIEQRLNMIAIDAQHIMDLVAKLDPNRKVLVPPTDIKYHAAESNIPPPSENRW